jgi:outer membrane protein OmpA-like peptidoglycan-associated protein
MKKHLLFIVLSSFLLTSLHAQFFMGLRSSPYGGVTNVNYNPAIADSRFICDVNLIAVGSTISNNYVGVDRKAIWQRGYVNSNLNFQRYYLKERVNGKDKSAYVGTMMQGPLSFMCSWGKGENKNKNAFAFTYHLNSIFNADKIDETFARLAYYGVGYTADSLFHFRDKQLKDANISLRTMEWIDYGLTYSRVAYDKGDHFIILGGTLKLLQGIAGGYAYVKDLNYKWEDYDTLSIFKTSANYAYSKGFVTSRGVETDGNTLTKNLFSFKYAAPSVAVDLGIVYQWRPDRDKYKYQMDCEDHWRYEQNRYKIAAGFSVIDIGGIRFKRGEYSGNFNADIQNWDVHGINFNSGLQSIDDTIRSRFQVAGDNKSTFTMWLPTRFNLFVDYNIKYGFGVNVAGSISPNMASKRNMVHQLSYFSITPKYDHAWFGAYLPFSIDQNANPNLGVTLRMGPLTVGMGDILGLFAKKFVFNTDVHVALKVTIPYHKIRDKDKDGVSNKKDLCPKEKGNCESKGCPDRDGDGITDSQDKCPDNPGPAELQGCPDTDGDGVIDMEDSCVTEKGPPDLHGCPDRDGDKIIDKIDECPDDAGLAQFNGCPDKDADGTPDKSDACPDVAGPKEHAGCPDTDGDGVYDNEDKCVTVKGPAENAGCPYPDQDGDGVLDKDDECPRIPGVPENKGCPQLEKKEIETVKYAFQNLEFETGKDIIRKSSYPSLNALAELLKKKPNYGLRLDGHTDDVGSDDKNMILSQKRAVAVQNYLIKRGVDGSKLEAFGHGETMPIADNKTAAGRQKNRRVEMKITFR